MDGRLSYSTVPATGMDAMDPSQEDIVRTLYGAIPPSDAQRKKREDLGVKTYADGMRDQEALYKPRGGAVGAIAASAVTLAPYLIPIIAPIISKAVRGLSGLLGSGAMPPSLAMGRGARPPNAVGAGLKKWFLERQPRYEKMDLSLINLKPYAFFAKLAKIMRKELIDLLMDMGLGERHAADVANELIRSIFGKHLTAVGAGGSKYSKRGRTYGFGDYGAPLVEGAIADVMKVAIGDLPPSIRKEVKRAAMAVNQKMIRKGTYTAHAKGGSFLDVVKTGWSKIKDAARNVWKVVGPTVKELAPQLVRPIADAIQKKAGIKDSALTDALKDVADNVVTDLSADRKIQAPQIIGKLIKPATEAATKAAVKRGYIKEDDALAELAGKTSDILAESFSRPRKTDDDVVEKPKGGKKARGVTLKLL